MAHDLWPWPRQRLGAPLKWNLFLDPLLNRMDNTTDPYPFTSKGITHELRIAAFAADDTNIVASTHEGYVEHMNMAIEYFSYFGVNFSPSKTLHIRPYPRQTLRFCSHSSK
jgi:hypothetical protein